MIRVGAFLLAAAVLPAFAANTPCSQSKGGINYCENGRFICNDGSVSQSKRVCNPAQYGEAKDRKKAAKDKPVSDKR
jgi:hypothetical protein